MKIKSLLVTTFVFLASVPAFGGIIDAVPGTPPPPPPVVDPLVDLIMALVQLFL